METKNQAVKNPWFWISVIAVIVIIVLAYKVMVPEEQEAIKTEPQPTDVPRQQVVSIDDDAVEGDSEAPVTIIEFSDYECPFCARFYTQTLPLIRENYIDTGKVKLVFRDFPLSFHPYAQKAAEAAECAGKEGDDKYYEMHDLLFEKGVDGGVDEYKEYAKEIGLSNDFDECLDSGEMAEEVKKDMDEGASVGVRGTPAFFINGKLVTGAQPYSVFEQAIEQGLR